MKITQGIPWSRKWQPTPVFSPGKFRGQRRPMACGPQGCKEYIRYNKNGEMDNFRNIENNLKKLKISKYF